MFTFTMMSCDYLIRLYCSACLPTEALANDNGNSERKSAEEIGVKVSGKSESNKTMTTPVKPMPYGAGHL